MGAKGISPADIRSLDDLQRFPLLVKQTLRDRREDMVWREQGPRLQLVRTSGSTNEALQFYTNSNREAAINAAETNAKARKVFARLIGSSLSG